GVVKKEGKQHYTIVPDAKSAHTPFFVLPGNLNRGRPGDKVVFELVQWDHPKALPEGDIIQVLGKEGTNDANILSILAESDITAPFPEEVQEFALNIDHKIPENEIRRRKDLRNDQIFTIDPA